MEIAANSVDSVENDALAVAEKKIANLEIALKTARACGMAIGIIMERHMVSADEAFGLLVHLSQHTHRKLNDIAGELVYTGALPIPA